MVAGVGCGEKMAASVGSMLCGRGVGAELEAEAEEALAAAAAEVAGGECMALLSSSWRRWLL